MDTQFDPKIEAVIEKVRKLLALADGNDNEHQAEAATTKARELLEAYNLDIAAISKTGNKFAPREKHKLRGGLYGWQRVLWNQVASINFCRYYFIRGLRAGSSYEHQLIGSKVNVISTTIMAQYLQDTIERLARKWVEENRPGRSVFIKEAIAFREGMANRLANRMWDMRMERYRQDEATRKKEREENAARGVFTENALVLVDVVHSEEDLNADYINGWEPGTSARNRVANEARQAAAEREAEELLRKQNEWDEAHPEEAAARKAKEKAAYDEQMQRNWKKYENQRQRKDTPEEARRRLGSYSEGYRKGADVSLDKQIDKNETRRLE